MHEDAHIPTGVAPNRLQQWVRFGVDFQRKPNAVDAEQDILRQFFLSP
jgi:hypothetical protein